MSSFNIELKDGRDVLVEEGTTFDTVIKENNLFFLVLQPRVYHFFPKKSDSNSIN